MLDSTRIMLEFNINLQVEVQPDMKGEDLEW